MKRQTIAVAGLMGLLLFVTGCNGDSLEEPTSQNYETLVGEIQSLGGVRVNRTVTHLFEEEDGDILYAYSNRYDLNSDDYFAQRLEVYGVVMEFDSLDKPVFEIRRITDAPEEEEEVEEVNTVDYKDTSFGFSMSYPDNWEFTSMRDGIQLNAPEPELDLEEDTEIEVDYVVVARVNDALSTDSTSEESDRRNEIVTWVHSNYDVYAGVAGTTHYVGPDGQFSVRFKSEQAALSYFVPRGNELFEVSFYHPMDEEGDRLNNTNSFTSMVNSFRFIPNDASEEESTEETEEKVETETETESTQDEEAVPEETTQQEEQSSQEEASTPQDITVPDGFSSFESLPYHFRVSYPKSWYYSGGNGGYDFAEEPIEDDTDILVRLDVNAGSSVGTSSSGNTFYVTVKVDGSFYTISGPVTIKDTLIAMAESITPVEEQ